jgi:site-specific DNA-methyltransferase (adenine-specific)
VNSLPLNQFIHSDSLTYLKTLPDNCVDLGITSPPYNKGENKKGWLVKNVKYLTASDKQPESVYQQQQIEVLNQLFRITKAGGSFFYNHKIRWEQGQLLHPLDWLRKTDWTLRQEIIWDRMIAANIRGWRFWQVEERIYWLYKPLGTHLIGTELAPHHALLTSIWRFSPEKNNPHPAPFPIALPARVIYALLENKKGVVIDPYSGSGTTALAATLLGHDFIGIEITPAYIDLAQQRLKNSTEDKKRIDQEIALHTVNKTFKERKQRGDCTGKHRHNTTPPISDLF